MGTGPQKIVQAGIKKELANAGHEVQISFIHGEASNGQGVYLGGADTRLGTFIRASHKAHGFQVKGHANFMLRGTSRRNICNRGLKKMGVQLEFAAGLRETFFESLTAEGRRKPFTITPITDNFFCQNHAYASPGKAELPTNIRNLVIWSPS